MSQDKLTTINPATGDKIDSFEQMSDDEAHRAVENCHAAYLQWRRKSPQERAALYGSFVRTIGAIHSVDVARAGLEDFGKAGGYIARQYKVPRSCEDLDRIGIALKPRPGAAGVVVAVPRGRDPSDRADGEIDGVDTRGDARRRRPHYAGPR